MKKNYFVCLFVFLLLSCFMTGCHSYQEGDVIEFGVSLEEKDKSLQWIVLECSDGEALLLSKDIVTYRSFHSKINTSITWQNSDICNWLNNDFYNNAFSEQEKERIVQSEVTTEKDGSSISSQNYVFLLSVQEAKKYVTDKGYNKKDSESVWLLRDEGQNSSYIACIIDEHIVQNPGVPMDSEQGIRPAIRIKIE